MVALLAFNALTIRIAIVREFADAAGGAFLFLAFFGNLRNAVDQKRQRGTAAGHTVHLGAAIFHVHFAITAALAFSFDWGVDSLAVGSLHADAMFIFQISFLAEAADDAVLGADWTWMGVGAGGRAGSAAGAVLLIGIAL